MKAERSDFTVKLEVYVFSLQAFKYYSKFVWFAEKNIIDIQSLSSKLYQSNIRIISGR